MKKQIIMYEMLIIIGMMVVSLVFSEPQYRYYVFLTDSSLNIIEKRVTIIDSNRFASDAEFRSNAIPYMAVKSIEFIGDTVAHGLLLSGRAEPTDPGNRGFFTRMYPCSILVNLFDDAMTPGGYHSYFFYGDSVSRKSGLDTIKPNDYMMVKQSEWSNDTVITANEKNSLSSILSDMDIVALQDYSLIIYIYKHSFSNWDNYQRDTSLGLTVVRYLVFVCHELSIQLSTVEKKDGGYGVQRILVNPNPFSLKTTITFSGTQDRESVKLNIIDPTGRVVRSMSGSANGGKVSYVWDGTDKNGKALARGVYVANVVGKGVNMKKLLVLTK